MSSYRYVPLPKADTPRMEISIRGLAITPSSRRNTVSNNPTCLFYATSEMEVTATRRWPLLVIAMKGTRPLALLLVTVMAVSMFAAPVAASGSSDNDCNAYSSSGTAVATGSSLAVSASSASVSATQAAGQYNEISNTETNSGSANQFQTGTFVQGNSANQNQC